MIIDANGKLGLGLTSPAETLDINGTTRFRNSMYGYNYPSIRFYRGTDLTRTVGQLIPGYNNFYIGAGGGGGFGCYIHMGDSGRGTSTQLVSNFALTVVSDDRIKFREEELSYSQQLYEDFKKIKVYKYEKFLSNDKDFENNIWIPTDEEWEVKRLDEDTPKSNETGLIAQKMRALSSFSDDVSGSEYDENGKQTILSVNYQTVFLKTMLIVQQLIQEIEELKGRVEALES